MTVVPFIPTRRVPGPRPTITTSLLLQLVLQHLYKYLQQDKTLLDSTINLFFYNRLIHFDGSDGQQAFVL